MRLLRLTEKVKNRYTNLGFLGFVCESMSGCLSKNTSLLLYLKTCCKKLQTNKHWTLFKAWLFNLHIFFSTSASKQANDHFLYYPPHPLDAFLDTRQNSVKYMGVLQNSRKWYPSPIRIPYIKSNIRGDAGSLTK